MLLRRLTVSAVVLGLGCAPAALPQELADARAAYQRAASGPAANEAPATLQRARTALDQAEEAYARTPGANGTRDLAYVAERRSEAAMAAAMAAQAQRQLEAAAEQARIARALTQQRRPARVGPAALAGDAPGAAGAPAAVVDPERAGVERQLRAALEGAGGLAELRREERGLVIRLAADALFLADAATFQPGARAPLAALAAALKRTSQRLLVEGHSDLEGSAGHNQDLSSQRAVAVRDLLAAYGLPAARLDAIGFGESRPVADNATPEGRARNRRVEIILAATPASQP